METNDKLSVHIKEVRAKKGISMYSISKVLNKANQSHLSRIELGMVTPSVTVALEIARALNCKVEDIYKLTTKSNGKSKE